MAERTFRRRLRDGETTVGTFQIIDSPMVSEIVGLSGTDFTIIDQEHGPLTAGSAVAMCAAAERGGAAPIVHVRENTEGEIQRALDLGAAGVEIPQIETREDAEAAVDHARFSPLGGRGLSPYTRAAVGASRRTPARRATGAAPTTPTDRTRKWPSSSTSRASAASRTSTRS